LTLKEEVEKPFHLKGNNGKTFGIEGEEKIFDFRFV